MAAASSEGALAAKERASLAASSEVVVVMPSRMRVALADSVLAAVAVEARPLDRLLALRAVLAMPSSSFPPSHRSVT